MLMLKLQRIGKKHQAAYRLIVGEKREKLDGAQLEDLGWFDPKTGKVELKKERILYWIGMGAGKSDTVHNLLVTAGIVEGKKIAVHKQPKKKEGDKAAEAPKAEAAKSTEAPKEESSKPASVEATADKAETPAAA